MSLVLVGEFLTSRPPGKSSIILKIREGRVPAAAWQLLLRLITFENTFKNKSDKKKQD